MSKTIASRAKNRKPKRKPAAGRVALWRSVSEESLAKHIAREVFKCGDEPNSPCNRIQFMGGKLSPDPSTEKEQGGFIEMALALTISTALNTYTPNAGGQT